MVLATGEINSSLDATQLTSRIYQEHREFVRKIISINSKNLNDADDIFPLA